MDKIIGWIKQCAVLCMHVCTCLSDVCVGVWGNMFSGHNCKHWIVDCFIGRSEVEWGGIGPTCLLKEIASPPYTHTLYMQNYVMLL